MNERIEDGFTFTYVCEECERTIHVVNGIEQESDHEWRGPEDQKPRWENYVDEYGYG